jgi:hypothetical protein
MNWDEAEAIDALGRFAAALGVRLPCDVSALLGKALQWRGGNPLHNSLVPGFVPLEYSFSTWHPEEFRIAAQLFAALTAPERRARTVELVWRLADRYLRAIPAPHDVGAIMPAVPRRFGAFFGMAIGPGGLTGVEAYLEAEEGEERVSWLPSQLHEALRLVIRPVFTGIGIRSGMVQRRAYHAATSDLEVNNLRQALRACDPSHEVGTMLMSLNDVVGRRHVLPQGTVMVTSTEDGSMWSVELHAASYSVDLASLPTRLAGLRSAAFDRWVMAVGGHRAAATVVSIRFSERFGPGIAVYAVPVWARHVSLSVSEPMICPPFTDS